jgi:PKD repeat protein
MAAIVIAAGVLLAAAPNAPSDFAGTATGTDSIEWTWTDNNHAPDNESGHRVYDAANHTAVSIPDLPPDSTSFAETGLGENEKCERYVVAVGDSGGGEQLDQYQQTSSGTMAVGGSSAYIGQTFTAGLSGKLTRIRVWCGSSGNVTLQLSGGSVSASATVNVTSDGWYDFVFAPPPQITAGTQYTFTLYPPSSSTIKVYKSASSSSYPGGEMFYSFGSISGDLCFETYVMQGEISDPSNTDTKYTLVHKPLDTEIHITTVIGSLDVDISVDPPPNQDADLTGLQIRRDTNADMTGAEVIKAFDDPGYSFTDTVPASGTYYYGFTFRNGDGVETTETIGGQIDVVGELPVPANFTGTGSAVDKILWEWTDDVTYASGYVLQDASGKIIALITRPADSYEETVSGENTSASRQLCSAVFGTTTVGVEVGDPLNGSPLPWRVEGYHAQYLYTSSELSSQAGNIKRIYWRRIKPGDFDETFSNVVVILGHASTTLASLGSAYADNFTEGDATEVWNTESYTVPATSLTYQWTEIPITGTFYYDGINNLVLDINVTSGTTSLSWLQFTVPDDTAMYGSTGASSGTPWARKFLTRFLMDVVKSMSAPTTPPYVAYSLVHDATVDDFSLALGASPNEVVVTVIEPLNAYLELTGVRIERSTDPGWGDVTTVRDFSNVYTYTDTVTPGQTYYYRVTYCNGQGTPSLESLGRQIDVPPISDAPVAEITDPTGGIHSGEVTITYTLTDPQGDTCSIVVEYSLDSGSTWASCTKGPTGDDVVGLSSSSTGTVHTYSWDTVADGVGASATEAVDIKITPSDTEQGTPGTTSFSVSNTSGEQPPVAEITDPTSGAHNGDITITYTLSDLESDTSGTTVEYNLDGSTWSLCTPVSGTNPVNGLGSSPTGDPHTFDWNSAADGVGVGGDVSVQVMITPWDNDGEGTPDTVTFTVNNVPQEPPSVTITDPTGGTHYADVTISYTLVDSNSDTCTILVEYTIVGSGTWDSCIPGTGGDGTSGLDSGPAGVTHTFVWDTVADGVGTAGPEDVQVRITPYDTVEGATGTSSQFTVDNTGPEPVDAAFAADTTTGPASLTVNFTDQSTGTYDSWYWDFDDGGASTDQNPTHTYNLVGTYTVTLIIDGPEGSDSEIKIDYITVTDPGFLKAGFFATPTSGAAPLDVQFADQSVGAIDTWQWDFGDGSTSAGTDRNPSHTYASSGLYTVTLTVSGSSGSDTETKTTYISVTSTPSSGGSNGGGGCSCTVDRSPTLLNHLLGYFLPVFLLVCAYLALRRHAS